jgi:ubiquinone/menaquinone biosynthesis C-methylase UbiE
VPILWNERSSIGVALVLSIRLMMNLRMSLFNYFGKGMDGDRYSRSRPYIHGTAVERIRALSGIAAPVHCVLDVGCGTGQSTIALAEIGHSIIGMDPSAEMLAHALPHSRIQYVQASAENIPLSSDHFDLIAAAQAFHWFNQEVFLREANRLLQTGGWLTIYTSWFTGELRENSNFSSWFKREFLDRYPSPPRYRQSVTAELAHAHGFLICGEDDFTNDIGMSIERFTDYQLSATNIIAAVERGEHTYENAAQWIRASLAPFFADEANRTFLFTGKLWCLQKVRTCSIPT